MRSLWQRFRERIRGCQRAESTQGQAALPLTVWGESQQ